MKREWFFAQPHKSAPPAFCERNSSGVHFYEHPQQPAEHALNALLPFKESCKLLILPPCSFETITRLAKSLHSLQQVIIIDTIKSRLDTWQTTAARAGMKGITCLHLTENLNLDKEAFIKAIAAKNKAALYQWNVCMYFPQGYTRFDQTTIDYTQQLLEHTRQKVSMKVRYQVGEAWHHMVNSIVNLKADSTKYTLEASDERKPFIIVGAGPSLDKNIEILKQYKDKATILCCERAIGTLKRHNIKPDYLLSLENVLGMWFHFEPHKEFLKDIPLICPPLVSHVVARNYPGPIVFTKIKVNDTWLDDFPKSLIESDLGECVGQFGFHIADALDASQIILVGNDLAYNSDGKSHTSSTHSQVTPKNMKNVQGFYNNEVMTTGTFEHYIHGFELMIKNSSAEVINATEGGAHIPGATHASLESTLQALPKSSKTYCEKINEPELNQYMTAKLSTIRSLKEKTQEIKSILATSTQLEPKNYFGYISDVDQQMINHFINPELYLHYEDILYHFSEKRSEELKAILLEMCNSITYACSYIEMIYAISEYSSAEKKNCLVLQPEDNDLTQYLKDYTRLSITTVPTTMPLPALWNLIIQKNIGTVISFDKNVSADLWTAAKIQCIDIRSGSAFPNHPVIDYTLAALSKEQLESWPINFRSGIKSGLLCEILENLNSDNS